MFQSLTKQPFPLFLCLGRIFPGNVPIQILQQMLTGALELVTDHTQPEKPGAESILLIAALGTAPGCGFLNKTLMGDGKTELDVGLHLTGMEGRVEHPELDGAL